MEQKVKMSIVALTSVEGQNNGFIVVLKETEEGNRRLPIVIGPYEAQALALSLEGIKPNRPLTHDLFRNVLEALHVSLEEVIISELTSGVFFAKLVCRNPSGEVIEVDSRTSDALALAVRVDCPIYANRSVLDEAGMSIESDKPSIKRKKKKEKPVSLNNMTMKELSEKLQKAIESEDYEQAAKIRDEQKARENQQS